MTICNDKCEKDINNNINNRIDEVSIIFKTKIKILQRKLTNNKNSI